MRNEAKRIDSCARPGCPGSDDARRARHRDGATRISHRRIMSSTGDDAEGRQCALRRGTPYRDGVYSRHAQGPLTMHIRTFRSFPARVLLLACLISLAACGGGSSDGATPTPMPTVSIAASPASIAAGGSSTLTWSSTDATSCTASGDWSGTKASSGSASVTPAATASYTLACTGAGAGEHVAGRGRGRDAGRP